MAHLQKNVRVHKRPSRAALSGPALVFPWRNFLMLTILLLEAGLQLTHFCACRSQSVCSYQALDLRSSRYTFVQALPEIGSRQDKVYSLVRANGPELIMALVRFLEGIKIGNLSGC